MGYDVRFKSKPIKLRLDTPKEIIQLLNILVNDYKETDTNKLIIPNHKFFTLDRWRNIFCSSAFEDEEASFEINRHGNYVLFVNNHIKHGWEEAREFAKWITPYVIGHKPKEFIGTLKGDEHYDRKNIYIEREIIKRRL